MTISKPLRVAFILPISIVRPLQNLFLYSGLSVMFSDLHQVARRNCWLKICFCIGIKHLVDRVCFLKQYKSWNKYEERGREGKKRKERKKKRTFPLKEVAVFFQKMKQCLFSYFQSPQLGYEIPWGKKCIVFACIFLVTSTESCIW